MRAVDVPNRPPQLNAELYCVGRRCDIFQIHAAHVEIREARGALEQLRNRFELIRAIGPGGATNPAHVFWRQMANEGLVDVLLDECGRVLWPTPAPRGAPSTTCGEAG